MERMALLQQRTPLQKWVALTKGIMELEEKKKSKPKSKWDLLLEKIAEQKKRTPL